MISTTPVTTRPRIPPESWLDYRALTSGEIVQLDAQREYVGELLREHCGAYTSPVLRSDLPVLQDLLEGISGNSGDVEAIGVVFGDILTNELSLEWFGFTSGGTQPCLVTDNFSLTLFPHRLLSRCADGTGKNDLETLFDQIADHQQRLLAH